MDHGTAVGLQATAVGIGIAAVLSGGHARAMEAVQRARDERAARQQAVIAAYTQYELAEARREIARLKAWHELLTAPLPMKKA
ncbi:hypothetical protein [Pseudaminobacter sp. NGMCC 1.201702]|uniref:hypothetical protein n=1 Tax=Pseudaminobacter sp. NGMCC 1.201702 TaxID=3391825 RepID=UPI0039EF999C